MAQVEFTQQWVHTVTNAGVTPSIYFQMQPVDGTYIVKGLSCYSTSGLQVVSGGGTKSSVTFLNGNSATPSSINLLYATRDAFAANEIVTAVTPSEQVILKKPYIGFIANMTGVGDFVFQISYSFIPASNELSATFLNSFLSVNSGATSASLTGSSSTIATIVKTITVLNLDQNGNAATVTPLLVSPTNAVATPFAEPLVLVAGFSGTFTFPLYLNNLTTVSMQNAGPAAVAILYSYTQDLI